MRHNVRNLVNIQRKRIDKKQSDRQKLEDGYMASIFANLFEPVSDKIALKEAGRVLLYKPEARTLLMQFWKSEKINKAIEASEYPNRKTS